MLVSTERILRNIEAAKDLPDDIRGAYRRAFLMAPGFITREETERRTEEALRYIDPDSAAYFHIPAEELMHGEKKPLSEVDAEAIEREISGVLPEHNSVRATFASALKDISGGAAKVSQRHIQDAFVIASGNPYPPSQQALRDGVHHDIGVLHGALQKFTPSLKLN